ncbi:uncharacterized protein BO97DRAFT_280348 [Aspergillus homomorphus CBS 101889]|uniref:Uncharacterized protein n=1 Tax=Aspergillus homomorphus (strain CBS 101889) TaxID=1450537 RepID=A0A395I398_ASPHC|nr:hypothetical protein BO97DRAFT_280348 [Aspergillus homomorphus CBS 101889]RAL14215.1 hypothetical protein BO97DRAFT_280348 [Aspergillus homomorphus CBS 101889]
MFRLWGAQAALVCIPDGVSSICLLFISSFFFFFQFCLSIPFLHSNFLLSQNPQYPAL